MSHVIVDRGRDVLAGELDDLRERSPRRHVEIAYSGANGWDAEHALPGVRLTAEAADRLSLSVPSELPPERVLHAAAEAGDGREFRYQPPRLSELFQETVRS